jgi:hypothetical protein
MLAAALTKLLSLSRFRLAPWSAALLLTSAAFGCGKPFNVKTQPTLPSASYAAKANLGDVTLEANAITDEDFLYDSFDANLIAAGVLPVRVMVTNSGSAPVEVRGARFEIDTQSTRYRSADPRKAFKRLISYYGISVYSKAGYKESLEAFTSYALDMATPLAADQARQGLVFFLVPAEVARGASLTLMIGKLKSKTSDIGAASLKLN